MPVWEVFRGETLGSDPSTRVSLPPTPTTRKVDPTLGGFPVPEMEGHVGVLVPPETRVAEGVVTETGDALGVTEKETPLNRGTRDRGPRPVWFGTQRVPQSGPPIIRRSQTRPTDKSTLAITGLEHPVPDPPFLDPLGPRPRS